MLLFGEEFICLFPESPNGLLNWQRAFAMAEFHESCFELEGRWISETGTKCDWESCMTRKDSKCPC